LERRGNRPFEALGQWTHMCDLKAVDVIV
jgi:hypothetical protein